MINCAIYPRKSKAVDNSDSMETQIAMCKRYLDDKYGSGNYTATIYDGDYGITGHSTKNRKDFQRMMDSVRAKRIQLVVIQRFDRIARNTRDFCNLYHDMEQAGCELVSVSQQIDTTTPYGKNFMYMQASMAELEWALCSERRKDAIRYANSVGKITLPNHSLPFGYKAEYIDGIRRLVKDKDKEPIVLDIFKHFGLYHNFMKTARDMNEKYGTTFENVRIRNIVRNKVYTGEYRGNKNFCEPYISAKEWESINAKKPVIRNDAKKKGEILFSGMIRCPACGRKMRSISKTKKNGNTYKYYHCEYHFQGMCSCKRTKSELMIEQMLLDKMESFLMDAEMTAIKNQTTDNSARFKAELNRLNTMYQKGRIDDDYYDTEYLRLTNLIAVNEANTKPQGNMDNAHKVISGDWKNVYQELDRLHRKLFWRELIQEIKVNTDMEVVGVIFL